LALQVAEFIGTQHHEFVFTIQEGIDALSDVIYQIETYDVTSIRASTPMYLMSRKIKAMGVKMVLSGVCGHGPFHRAAPGRIALFPFRL
jgi:asparagine synthase (glutamine-hydrolysing)